MRTSTLVSGAALLGCALSTPTPTQPERVQVRQVIPAKITSQSQFDDVIAGLERDGQIFQDNSKVFVEFLEALVPSPVAKDPPAALSSIASVYSAHPTDFFASAGRLVFEGLAPSDLVNLALGESPIENSSNNFNPISPVPAIYPKKGANDAPYSVDEKTLRAAMYIPLAFTYGKVQPVILVPGTGATAGENYAGNFGKLFTGSNYADPIYLNIPGNQLADIQVESEYVAYAINYISAISGHRNISVLTWSAGSVDAQWAMQYWPSTRPVVSDLITMSADFHGTTLAEIICPGFPHIKCPPAVIQQEYESNFIHTLRNGGGSSAYVPTTSVYSIFDEIVQPQEGDGASAFILDERNVGVTNVELQNACPLQPAGTLYSHEGVLYNPVAFALAKDALTHPGPGSLSRIDLASECQKITADGLGLIDIFATEGVIAIAAIEIIAAYANGTYTEPPIMPYAQKDTPK